MTQHCSPRPLHQHTRDSGSASPPLSERLPPALHSSPHPSIHPSIHCPIDTMADTVPEVLTIKEIYPKALGDAQEQRWEHLLARFEERYGKPADFVSRSPGRVNIIGEVSITRLQEAVFVCLFVCLFYLSIYLFLTSFLAAHRLHALLRPPHGRQRRLPPRRPSHARKQHRQAR